MTQHSLRVDEKTQKSFPSGRACLSLFTSPQAQIAMHSSLVREEGGERDEAQRSPRSPPPPPTPASNAYSRKLPTTGSHGQKLPAMAAFGLRGRHPYPSGINLLKFEEAIN